MALSLIGASRAEAVPSARDCVGPSAIGSASYSINGGARLDALPGNLPHGAAVDISLTARQGCDGTFAGVAMYAASGPVWISSQAANQVKISTTTASLSASHPTLLHVVVPDCYYQLDVFTGPALEKLSASNNYSTPAQRLIASSNGGVSICPEVGASAETASSMPFASSSTTTTPANVKSLSLAAATTSASSATSTTMAPEVLGESLARTGASLVGPGVIGVGLLLVGIALLGVRSVKRNS